MKLYTNTSFTGHFPVSTAAIVWAKGKKSAAKKLNAVLKNFGLEGDAMPEDMIEFKLEDDVLILQDGNY